MAVTLLLGPQGLRGLAVDHPHYHHCSAFCTKKNDFQSTKQIEEPKYQAKY